jgi:hypothetical protein
MGNCITIRNTDDHSSKIRNLSRKISHQIIGLGEVENTTRSRESSNTSNISVSQLTVRPRSSESLYLYSPLTYSSAEEYSDCQDCSEDFADLHRLIDLRNRSNDTRNYSALSPVQKNRKKSFIKLR